jgi:predicted CXXCH cytochrome family protein
MRPTILLLLLAVSCVLPPNPNINRPTPNTEAINSKEGPQLVAFSHISHYITKSTLNCTDCHSFSAQIADFGRPAHKACYSCHQDKNFAGENNSGFCQSCHNPKSNTLQTFPRDGKGSVWLADFNHKLHLNPNPENLDKFGRSNCDSCHNPNDTVAGSLLPAHKECIGCHGDGAGAIAIAPLLTSRATSQDCLGCHTDVRQ